MHPDGLFQTDQIQAFVEFCKYITHDVLDKQFARHLDKQAKADFLDPVDIMVLVLSFSYFFIGLLL